MRILVVLIAGCSGAASTPPPAPASPPPPAAFGGRVGITGESWTDVVIDGTDAAAHELCDVLLAIEQRGLSRLPVTGVYTRPCALATLATPSFKEPYLLVDTRQVDQDSELMDLILIGRSEPLKPAHGTRTTRVPMNDRATCEAMKKHLEADDKAAHDAVITATADFAAEQAEKAKDREQKACDRVRDDDQHRCADADQLCQTTHDHDRRECDEARQEREALEELQHRPPAPPVRTETRSCEPR